MKLTNKIGLLGKTVLVLLGVTILGLTFSRSLSAWSQEKLKNNLVKPYGGSTEERLRSSIYKQGVGQLGPGNFLKHAIRTAVNRGVPATTIFMIFFLPFIGAVADVFHYLVGLRGFGIYMPAMVATAFWDTGILGGLILFLLILLLTLLARRLLRGIKLHYWPRRAITLWVVSLSVFGFFALAPDLPLFRLRQISIFPIIFMILLVEEFIRVNLRKNQWAAIKRTAITLGLSILAAVLMGWLKFQQLVLLHPEITLFSVLVVSTLIGRYTGFRLLEYRRFRPALREEEE